MLAVTAGAFLVVAWVVTKGLFFFLQDFLSVGHAHAHIGFVLAGPTVWLNAWLQQPKWREKRASCWIL